MKQVFNYIVCTASIFIAVLFLLSGSIVWTLCGLAWGAMLYMWGVTFPKWWKMFWKSNLKILAFFDCL